jgi:hypothetical protein
MKLWEMRTLFFDMLNQGWVIVTQPVDTRYLTEIFSLYGQRSD